VTRHFRLGRFGQGHRQRELEAEGVDDVLLLDVGVWLFQNSVACV
jgi:hypothetical protein